MIKPIFILSVFLLCYTGIYAQIAKKRIDAVHANASIRIDGIPDEEAWKSAQSASDFIQQIPYNGKPSVLKTDVKFMYDNSGLYIAAIMHDPHPDSILRQLGLRDATDLNADFFEFQLCPFNDGINAFTFTVWASDVQTDFKEPDGELSWDAVWDSKAVIGKDGWYVEMRIPYSAIRFPKVSVQKWGINCRRGIRRYRENSTWNFVDSKVDGTVNQEGLLEGIKDIEPPLRLSVSPYVSGYLERGPDQKEWNFSYNYGADLKYGINESFTLDMTLIPDFGQVPSDDKVYNFSPFEIRYDEKRQFFNEGTELFNKGGIFYSRRIGSQPKGYDSVYNEVQPSEKVVENPMQTRLINASKISGRTSKGLGIGFFNAMSANTWATVMDTLTGQERQILTQGFTNYNMVVLDQALKNNSYFDLLNTNYFIPTAGYTANVSGTDFKFANNKYTYAVSGNLFVSQKYFSHDNPEFGYHHSLTLAKISGNFLCNYYQLLETPTYDPNDMGFNERNNKFDNQVKLQYNVYDPFWKVLNWYSSLYISYNCLYDDLKYTSFEIWGNSMTTTRKYLTIGTDFNFLPVPSHDYYEPRVPGYMYISPAEYNLTGWISSDYRKKFALDMDLSGYLASRDNSFGYAVTIAPRYRISNRLSVDYNLSYELTRNNIGYVKDSLDPDSKPFILFGKRDIQTITNVLHGNLMLNSKMSVDLRVRHYWVTFTYNDYYSLQKSGNLQPAEYSGNNNLNYNLFNLDLSYIWNFAPGSQVSVVWKNSIDQHSNLVMHDFFGDLHTTIISPASNSFSIRVIYYFDALYLKRRK